jgi:hypothetical protein
MDCLYCHKPLKGASKKYHVECGNIVNRIKAKERYDLDPEPSRACSRRRKKRPKCTCCGRNPIGKGNRFLCDLCFENDGDGWREDSGK